MRPYYEHGGIAIYHADCDLVFEDLRLHWGEQPFDLLLTDPPYGIGAHNGVGKYGRRKFDEADAETWDNEVAPHELLVRARLLAKRSIIWGGNYFSLPPSRKFLVWNKGAGFADRRFAECELAWCSWDGNAQLFHRDPLASRDYVIKWHPTEKPEALILWCLHVAEDHTPIVNVLDPFMGSGSTLVAAKRLGKTAVGIDRIEKFCEIAARRLSQDVLPFFQEEEQPSCLP